MHYRGTSVSVLLGCLLLPAALSTQAQESTLLWTVGQDDNGWPASPDGSGGPNASFLQENGVINPLPGNPAGSDNDYYFAGLYTTVIAGNGEYEPVGEVLADEEAAERAFAGGDNDLRYHFNLPATLQPTDKLTVTFDALNLHDGQPDTRYGIEVYVNGVLVQPEILIRGAQLGVDFTSRQFTVAEVNAQVGPGYDNIVSLRGINYNNDGGGNWMGIDYVQLNQEAQAVPSPVYPWSVGKDDGAWPVGDGGGENATFVQENGAVSALPGSPTSPETDSQADNDYYFAGLYTTLVQGNGDYVPVGLVPANEEAAERAFAGGDTELRYHFNLPNTIKPSDLMAVTFDALNLDDSAPTPRWGVEVLVNGVRVMPEFTVGVAQLNTAITTPAFTAASVNAQVGRGFDNIVTLRGISKSAEGGGNWMGIDYIKLQPVATPPPPAVLPWAVGINDNAWPAGNGGGANASFVQENGAVSALPGSPTSPEVDQQADNDYYLAGVYSTVIPANGAYTPVGTVSVNEEAAERAFAGGDTELRYHFNLPASLTANDKLSLNFDVLNLDTSGADPRWGVEVWVNSVKVMDELVVRQEQIGQQISTPAFTLGQVGAQAGPGFDNIVTLKGISYNGDGGGNWMGIDYIQMNPVLPPPFPWSVGKDDNAWPAGNGGGQNATFVQEAGVNSLPGNPANPEVDQQGDDDYYFAGNYTTTIPSLVAMEGDYTPVGFVLVNEETAERAFAGSDNTKRYHFNLPSTLTATDQLMITVDFNNLDTSASNDDPRYGFEIYFNGVKVQEEIVVRSAELDVDYTTAPFTLASVNAQTGEGPDNVVTLKGINYGAEGGGQWMGIDYITLNPLPKPVFPIEIGKDDNGWPLGDGGGANASFVQEAGVNGLPGNPSNPEVAQQADDDYYFAGIYSATIPSAVALYGDYEPAGIVPRNEEAAERAFAGTDNDLRYHFNLPETLKPSDKVVVTYDILNLEEGQADSRYGIEVYVNGVLVGPERVIRPADYDTDFSTEPFTLASVNAGFGIGKDNILALRGVNYSADGGGSWMGIDYVKLGLAPVAELKITAITTANNKVTITWEGAGTLESAPAVTGPWNPITPSTSPYTEDIVSAQNRFYRLKQ